MRELKLVILDAFHLDCLPSHPLGVRELKHFILQVTIKIVPSHPLGVRELKQNTGNRMSLKPAVAPFRGA